MTSSTSLCRIGPWKLLECHCGPARYERSLPATLVLSAVIWLARRLEDVSVETSYEASPLTRLRRLSARSSSD